MAELSISPLPPTPQADTPQLAAVYARVSTTDQADREYSLPSQIEGCLVWAQQHGYTVPQHYVFSEDYN